LHTHPTPLYHFAFPFTLTLAVSSYSFHFHSSSSAYKPFPPSSSPLPASALTATPLTASAPTAHPFPSTAFHPASSSFSPHATAYPSASFPALPCSCTHSPYHAPFNPSFLYSSTGPAHTPSPRQLLTSFYNPFPSSACPALSSSSPYSLPPFAFSPFPPLYTAQCHTPVSAPIRHHRHLARRMMIAWK